MVSLYEQHYANLQNSPQLDNVSDREVQPTGSTEGKECSNLLVLLSELYNFQVVSSILIFDIIRGLLDKDLTEIGVELLLKIVRSMCILPSLYSKTHLYSQQTLVSNFGKMIPLR